MSLEVAVRLSKRWAGACGGCAARCGRAGVPVEVRESLRRVTYPTEPPPTRPSSSTRSFETAHDAKNCFGTFNITGNRENIPRSRSTRASTRPSLAQSPDGRQFPLVHPAFRPSNTRGDSPTSHNLLVTAARHPFAAATPASPPKPSRRPPRPPSPPPRPPPPGRSHSRLRRRHRGTGRTTSPPRPPRTRRRNRIRRNPSRDFVRRRRREWRLR